MLSTEETGLLWQQFKRGDWEAYTKLYNQNIKLLTNYGHKFTRDRTLIEDAAHDLFIKLWTSRTSLGTPLSVKNYLYKSLRSILFRKPTAASTRLSGRLYNYKNKTVTRARFAYRPYRGRVETLYADPWQYSAWVPVGADGRFGAPVKTPKGTFEYKAVAEQSGIAVEGDTKLVN